MFMVVSWSSVECACTLQNTNPSVLNPGMSYLPSEGIVEDIIVMDAVSVSSVDGERLDLQDKVR